MSRSQNRGRFFFWWYLNMVDMFYGRIGRRLILSFVILVVVVVGGCGWFFFNLIYRQLDRQLDNHLMAVAQLVAEKFDGDVVLRLKPEYEIYRRLRLQLINLCDLVNAERIYVFNKEGRCLIDTGSGAVVGKPYPRLAFDRKEVASVWRGMPSSSLRFQDANGVDFQTGYAPIKSGSEVIAAVGVEIGVGFVEALRTFGHGAFLLAGGAAAITLLAGLALSKSVTGPIAKLVEAAQAIGKGELTKPVRPPSRDELGYLGQTLDDMRRGLLARDERLRQMLAGVAHEIRNPLGGIELHAGLIAMDLDQDDARRVHIEKVIGEVHTLDRVISDFIAFARPPSSRAESVEIAQLVSDTAFLLAPEMDEAQVTFVQDVDEGLALYADLGQVKRALINLMKNAIQAMPEGGELKVAALDGDAMVSIMVSDTGVGILPDDLNRLFEPFYSTREKGSGLGLAIVQQTMIENGGQVAVESELGVGTTFRLVLPRAKKEDSA